MTLGDSLFISEDSKYTRKSLDIIDGKETTEDAKWYNLKVQNAKKIGTDLYSSSKVYGWSYLHI